MIGYIQGQDVAHWQSQLEGWIDGIVDESLSGWSMADKLALVMHDKAQRSAQIRNTHANAYISRDATCQQNPEMALWQLRCS